MFQRFTPSYGICDLVDRRLLKVTVIFMTYEHNNNTLIGMGSK